MEKTPQRGPAPQPQAMRMRLAQNKDSTYIFGNLAAVSPQDVPPSRDRSDIPLLLNDRYVVTARPLQGFPPGHISLSDPQRTWAGISMTDEVKVQYYDPFRQGGNAFLVSMDVTVGFAGKKQTEAPYDEEDLQQHVVRFFENQIFAPGQQFLMDHKSIPLKLAVGKVKLGDLSMNHQPSSEERDRDPRSRGILTRHTEVNFFRDPQRSVNLKASVKRGPQNAIVQPDFKFEDMGIGGLDSEFSTIFRRAFASRIFPPGLVEKLGIPHVRGILLHGPPGTGKTLIARQIGKLLNAREPKVINGPEVLNKYVGQSEENIRNLFADAEKEYKEKKEESGLHIIIFDELDAVCRQRGSGAAGGTGVGDSVVNQLLSKLDGVDQLNNILLIGMTNRMDMIDDALLRPGRLEVHVEISLPDEAGRVDILNIHTQKMRVNELMEQDVDINELASLTKNYTGAEISGLVKGASSFAFTRHIKVGTMADVSKDAADIKVSRDDFMHALGEFHPAYGVSEETLGRCLEGGLIRYAPIINEILHNGELFVNQVRNDEDTSILSILFHGPPGCGKTALAAQTALKSEYPFIKLISPEDMVGFNELAKVQHINKIFTDAYKSKLSVLFIDDIEVLFDWSPVGPRFSNTVLVALRTLLRKKPPPGRRLLILATTDQPSTLDLLDLKKHFTARVPVPFVRSPQELFNILEQTGDFGNSSERKRAVSGIGSARIEIGIKHVLTALKTARQDANPVDRFVTMVTQAMEDYRSTSADAAGPSAEIDAEMQWQRNANNQG